MNAENYLQTLLPLLWSGRTDEAKAKLEADLVNAKHSVAVAKQMLADAEDVLRIVESVRASATQGVLPLSGSAYIPAESATENNRRLHIIGAAKEVVKQTKIKDFTIEQVKDMLEKHDVDLGVADPTKVGTSIGNTLGKDAQFIRLGPGLYRYLPNDIPGAVNGVSGVLGNGLTITHSLPGVSVIRQE